MTAQRKKYTLSYMDLRELREIDNSFAQNADSEISYSTDESEYVFRMQRRSDWAALQPLSYHRVTNTILVLGIWQIRHGAVQAIAYDYDCTQIRWIVGSTVHGRVPAHAGMRACAGRTIAKEKEEMVKYI